MARRKKKYRKNTRRRARRHARKSPRHARRHGRRHARRLRRNPGSGPFARVAPLQPAGAFGEQVAPGLWAPARKPRKAGKRGKKHGRKLSAKTKRRRALARRLRSKATSLRKRAKGMKRGMRKSVALTQARRLSTLSRIARRGGKLTRSPVYKAMHVKSNPGFDGVVASAKVLAPQVAVGGVALFGVAMAGKMLAGKINEAAGASIPPAVQPYLPAISSVVLSGVGYVVADKIAPKYKGAVAIGGLLGAVVQAVVAAAASSADENSILAKAKSALLGDYTLVGDYTTVGGRAYAEAGIFREIGEVSEAREGGAYSLGRPRNYGDNRTQWAMSGLGRSEAREGGAYSLGRPRNTADNDTEWAVNGLDDTTEFAPGEGGVLSGGLFRGPSSR